jgi:hypothetical protein
MKLIYYNKLTDIDMQILLYMSHVIVKDLVLAKINNKIYENSFDPAELMDFLHRYKIELQNLGIYNDNRTANQSEHTATIGPNASVYSFQPSVTDSKDEE